MQQQGLRQWVTYWIILFLECINAILQEGLLFTLKEESFIYPFAPEQHLAY